MNLPLQKAAFDIWQKKYRLQSYAQNYVDTGVDDNYRRVAKALASVEPKDREYWENEFYNSMAVWGAIPAGRIMSNAGAEQYKPSTSMINCTVSGTIPDSINGIMKKAHEAALTLHGGSGIGYEFSTLRPSGAMVGGVGATTSGPLTFMDIFNSMCFTISSAGGRRGAQMATFDVRHPDVEEFIRVKRESGRLRQFNLSLLITDEFLSAVEHDTYFDLIFPVLPAEQRHYGLKWSGDAVASNGELPFEITFDDWVRHENDGYMVDSYGKVVCRIYKTVRAKDLWDSIMTSTYDYAEPGFILIDEVNRMNNLWFCENIRACNPCGEQQLPPYGSCLLGSIDLTRYVTAPYGDEASFDFETLAVTVKSFSRMLDNVVEINGLALPEQRAELEEKRRHGMGFFGLGSALVMLGIKYGSDSAQALTEKITKVMALASYEAGVDLAKEKGRAPIFNGKTLLTPELFYRNELLGDYYQIGDEVDNLELWLLSPFMQRIKNVSPKLWGDLSMHGCRYTHALSIAPTGTTALSFGNNASGGIEPSFSHYYSRNVIIEGKKSKQRMGVFSYELLAYLALYAERNGATFDVNDIDLDFVAKWMDPENTEYQLPEAFVDAQTISARDHVRMQAAAQKWIDSSISKTTNVPSGYPYEAFKKLYMMAAKNGCKGLTTYRPNPEHLGAVLTTEETLKNTRYKFTLADGNTVILSGNEDVMYDGQSHNAANLFEALREGTYGKH